MKRYINNKNKLIFTFLVLLIISVGIGYAILTQQLTLDNTISYDSMKWDVGFTEVVDNGGTKPSTGNIIDNGKSITVSCDIGISANQESCIIKAKITNNSTFDIALFEEPIIIYESQNIHTVTFKWNNHPTYGYHAVHKSDFIAKGKSEEVILTIKTKYLNKDMLSLEPLSIEIKVSLNFQEWQGGELPKKDDLSILKSTTNTDTTAFRSSTYKNKIKSITFEEKINIPTTATESWDISENQNGKVMAYVTPNESNSDYYDLYIQGNNKIYANKNMSYYFYEMTYLDKINGLELLDTSITSNMSSMFYETGYNSDSFTLDVSNFDTRNVTNMSSMFYKTGFNNPNFQIDVSNFDTSKVTSMKGMFQNTGYNSKKFTLDVSNFDTRNVTNMSSMFYCTGNSSTTINLDVSNFKTSKVIDMRYMFYSTGYNNPKFTLDVKRFNTSNVTDMRYMFYSTGYKCTTFTLDVSNFDTSKVTNMESMFEYAGYNSTKLNTSITIRNPNTASYSYMFSNVATKTGSKITVNYTSATSNLVDQMINTKSPESNVIKGVQVD